MSDIKQQIVEKLKDNSSILVTVNANPSVDELSAMLGLTLLLNKMNKHATAIFSGEVPPAIEFLEPEKTLESTVDSLRDFIIALDKEKADHLRYKVVDDVVKIFITPYRTTISEKDLDFSQGDYNVEMVIAIGVRDSRDIDRALEAHGQILEDAVVVTLSCGDTVGSLGSIDWHESRASSYCEMAMNLVEAIKSEKDLVDEQIATAFLTGLVAATERFSNNKTSSRVMTIAAQLMGRGANQQLIATKLSQASEAVATDSGETPPETPKQESGRSRKKNRADKPGKNDKSNTNGGGEAGDKSAEPPSQPPEGGDAPSSVDDGGALRISHQPTGTLEEVEAVVRADQQAQAAEAAESQLEDAQKARETEQQQQAAARAEAQLIQQTDQAKKDAPPLEEPDYGGTLNATTEQASRDARRALEEDKNHKLLSHDTGLENTGYLVTPPPDRQSPLNSTMAELAGPPLEQPSAPDSLTMPTARVSDIAPSDPGMTLADLDNKHREARSDIEAALRESDSQMQQPPVLAAAPAEASAGVPPLPPLPPMPDFSTLPPLPPSMATPPVAPEPSAPLEPAPDPNVKKDPSQFHIPGK